ncbi:MAG: ferrous iron transporter B [Methylotenera sp.]|nr:ferrous iron transporter B [Oligoflexia bacterium]
MDALVLVIPRIALAGNPNCGKTALFNALTGGRQKVGNYPGVTVERKEGIAKSRSGQTLSILDLPGTYSLDARTPDEEITRDVLLGRRLDEESPQVLIAVADATNLERNLGLVLELKALKRPVVLALNMMDLARSRGLDLNLEVLAKELGVPVVPTVATKKQGIDELLEALVLQYKRQQHPNAAEIAEHHEWRKPTHDEVRARFIEVDRILGLSTRTKANPTIWSDRIDHIVLHPVWGSIVLVVLLATIFQTIFSWATIPQDWIKQGIGLFGTFVGGLLQEGPLRSLLVDGIIAGVGAVLVFLPQILLLFAFILILEDSGYMARAAFLMDRVMGRVGLHGRAFIPLLSSHACAIPGIMATRTIENPRDRLTTILVAPLTTCSARLPVYSLLIAAFIPNTVVWGPIRLQGLVMFGLYAAGIFAALLMAVVLRSTLFRGPKPPLLMELPTYKKPSAVNVMMGLRERAWLFLKRVGTVILTISIVLWFLASYPKAPAGATEPAINFSYAGRVGHAIEPVLRPLGFDWRVGIALIPGFAAREVMVGALATVYAIEAANEESKVSALGEILRKNWSTATALSLLVWYILACQCLSTLAVTRRETNSWRWPLFMVGYMTVLAYGGSFVTYHVAVWLGLG